MKVTTICKYSIIRLLSAIISGLLLALSIHSPGIWQLSWIALVPALLASAGQNAKTSTLLWLTTGLVYYSVLLSWMRIFGTEPWIGLVIIQSLYFGIFGWLLPRVTKDSRCQWMLYLPALWVSMQYLRTLGMFGFTWGSLEHIQGASAFASKPAAWGPWVVEFLVFQCNSAIAFAASRADRYISAYSRAGGILVPFALFFVFAVSALPFIDQPNESSGSVAVIQGNEPQDVQVTPGYLEAVFELYEETSRSISTPAPRLIVWPETTIPVDFAANGYLQRAQELALETGSSFVIGAYSASPNRRDSRYRNSAFVIESDGSVSGVYSKCRLVPFGEFVPARRYLKSIISKFPVRKQDVLPGDRREIIESSAGRLGVMICFESLFSNIARELTADGAQMLVVITNDSWFGQSQAAYQHLLMSRLRAVETDRYVVRAAATGISALIDPSGELIASAPIFRSSVLEGTSETRKTRTPYTITGDISAYILVLLSLVRLAYSLKRTRAD